jgi:hypothetical protein
MKLTKRDWAAVNLAEIYELAQKVKVQDADFRHPVGEIYRPMVAFVAPGPFSPKAELAFMDMLAEIADPDEPWRTGYQTYHHKWRMRSGPSIPTSEQVATGVYFVDKEMAVVQPALVVPLGGIAAFPWYKTATPALGEVHLKRNRLTMPIRHPETVVAAPRLRGESTELLHRAFEVARELREEQSK